MWHGSFVRLRDDHPTSRQSCTVPLSKSRASIPRNGIASSAKLHFHLIIGFKDVGPCTASDWVWKKLHLWPDESDLYRRITALSLQWPHTLPLILPRILALRPMDVEGAGVHSIVPCEVLYTEFNQNEAVSFARLSSTVLSVFDCFFKLEAMTIISVRVWQQRPLHGHKSPNFSQSTVIALRGNQ